MKYKDIARKLIKQGETVASLFVYIAKELSPLLNDTESPLHILRDATKAKEYLQGFINRQLEEMDETNKKLARMRYSNMMRNNAVPAVRKLTGKKVKRDISFDNTELVEDIFGV